MATQIFIPTSRLSNINFKFSPMVLSTYQSYIPVIALMWGEVVGTGKDRILRYPNVNYDINTKRIVFTGRRAEYTFIKSNNDRLYTGDKINGGITYVPSTLESEGYIAETALNLSYATASGNLMPLISLAIKPDKLWTIKDSRGIDTGIGWCDAKDFVILVDREFRKREHNYLWRNYNRIFNRMEMANAIDILRNVDIMELCYRPIPLDQYPSVSEAIERLSIMTAEFSELVNPTEIEYIEPDVNIVDDTEINIIDDTEPPSLGESIRYTAYDGLMIEANLDHWIREWEEEQRREVARLMIQQAARDRIRERVENEQSLFDALTDRRRMPRGTTVQQMMDDLARRNQP